MSAMNQHQQNKASLLERLIFNNRPVVIFLCLLVSVFLFYQATQVRPSTSFEKMIPLEHPFIQKMLEHRNDLANLGNTVRISVEAVNGDIFTKEYMETLRQIHDEVFYIPGVDRSGLKSLWSPSVRWTEVTEEGFAGGEVIPQTYDGSPRALEELRNNVLKSGQIGRLVANNFKSSIVDVPLLEMYPNPKNQSELIKLDYRQFSHEPGREDPRQVPVAEPQREGAHRRLREEGRRPDRRAGDGGRLLRYLPADHPGPAVLVHQVHPQHHRRADHHPGRGALAASACSTWSVSASIPIRCWCRS